MNNKLPQSETKPCSLKKPNWLCLIDRPPDPRPENLEECPKGQEYVDNIYYDKGKTFEDMEGQINDLHSHGDEDAERLENARLIFMTECQRYQDEKTFEREMRLRRARQSQSAGAHTPDLSKNLTEYIETVFKAIRTGFFLDRIARSELETELQGLESSGFAKETESIRKELKKSKKHTLSPSDMPVVDYVKLLFHEAFLWVAPLQPCYYKQWFSDEDISESGMVDLDFRIDGVQITEYEAILAEPVQKCLKNVDTFAKLELEAQAEEIRAAFREWERWYWYQYVKSGYARNGSHYDVLLLPLVEEIERREGLTVGKKDRDLFSLVQRYDNYVDAVLQSNGISVDDAPTKVTERCTLPKQAAIMRAKWNALVAVTERKVFLDTLDPDTIRAYGIKSMECDADTTEPEQPHIEEKGIRLILPTGERFISEQELDLENIKDRPTKNLAKLEKVCQRIVDILWREEQKRRRGLFMNEINDAFPSKKDAFDKRHVERYVRILKKHDVVSYDEEYAHYLAKKPLQERQLKPRKSSRFSRSR